MVESNELICADMAVEELNMESKESQAKWEECEKQMREHGIVVISASDDAGSDAEAWERPSKKLKNFEYQDEIGSAVQVLSKPGICHKGVISDFDEIGLYLRVSPRLGSPQVHVAYEDIINIELL